MDCDICYSHYDHSIHKPYMLSCPHTFCISCVNRLTTNKCPTCNAEIFIKNPNIALLNLISESSYDQLKDSLQKSLNKINEIKNELKTKSETKLNKYLAKIDSAKEGIKNEANKLIQLIKSSELKLLTVFLALCASAGTSAAQVVSIRILRARGGAAMCRELEGDSANEAEHDLPRPPAQPAPTRMLPASLF